MSDYWNFTKEKSKAVTRLFEAADEVLSNAIDLGEVFVDEGKEDDPENPYPVDDEGRMWYHDWWELNKSLDEIIKLELN